METDGGSVSFHILGACRSRFRRLNWKFCYTKENNLRLCLFPSPQTSVVNYIDQRTKARSDQLFFVVFEWKDPFIQTVQDVSNSLVPAGIVF